MRGPPITIACDCGELRHVPYGEAWECESCGRRWNTAQIPADEYWGIMRGMRRMRLAVIAVALGLFAAFALLAVFVSEGLFLLLPVVLGMWFLMFMPWWRRRIRRQARSLPRWKLHPE
jgi:Flp pilus assembly protein TadB